MHTSMPIYMQVELRNGIIWCWAAKLVNCPELPDFCKLDMLQVDCVGKPGIPRSVCVCVCVCVAVYCKGSAPPWAGSRTAGCVCGMGLYVCMCVCVCV